MGDPENLTNFEKGIIQTITNDIGSHGRFVSNQERLLFVQQNFIRYKEHLIRKGEELSLPFRNLVVLFEQTGPVRKRDQQRTISPACETKLGRIDMGNQGYNESHRRRRR